MIKNKLLRNTLFVYFVIMLLSIIFLTLGTLDSTLWKSIVFPYTLATLYFLSGIAAINFGINKPSQLFLMSVFGGMVIRMLFMLLIVFISIKFFEIKLWIYIFVLFVTYFLYMILEIIYLNLLKTKQLK